jgi:hypothetical protein
MPFKLPNFGKLLKMKYNFNPVLQNQLVLYLFLFMTFTQVILFVSNNDILGIVLMCIIGFLTSFFSKNMIVILCVALIMTNLVKKGMKQVGYEGFEDQENNEDDKNKIDNKDNKNKEDNEKSTDTKDEMKKQFEELKKEYPEFSALKEDIVDAMQKIDPILDKAETFMNKYSKYKSEKK